MKIIKRKRVIREMILVVGTPGDPELTELLLSSEWTLDIKFPGNRKFKFIREYPEPQQANLEPSPPTHGDPKTAPNRANFDDYAQMS